MSNEDEEQNFVKALKKEVFTVKEVAQMFEVSPYTIRRWCREGLIEFHKGSNTRLFFTKENIVKRTQAMWGVAKLD